MHTTDCSKRVEQIALEINFVRRYARWKDDDDVWHSLSDLSLGKNCNHQEKNLREAAAMHHWRDYKPENLDVNACSPANATNVEAPIGCARLTL